MTEDLDLYQQLFRSERATRYLIQQTAFSEQDVIATLEQRLSHWNQYGFGAFTLVQKGSQRKIGYVAVEVVAGNTQYVELHFALLPEFSGYGFATEAGKACIDFAFALGRDSYIFGVARSQNIDSIRVLEKLGMKSCQQLGLQQPDLYPAAEVTILVLTRRSF